MWLYVILQSAECSWQVEIASLFRLVRKLPSVLQIAHLQNMYVCQHTVFDVNMRFWYHCVFYWLVSPCKAASWQYS